MPKTRYAKCGDLSIAYQVVGDGAVDIVLVPSFVSHLDLLWASPAGKFFFDELQRFSRLILFDKAGTGMSDPVSVWPTPEHRVSELLAVMDAAGSERAVVMGLSEGGPAAIVAAATRPDRVQALITFGASSWTPFQSVDEFIETPYEEMARRGPEYAERLRVSEEAMSRYMLQPEQWHRFQRFAEAARDRWGEGEALQALLPSQARPQCGMFERLSASPGMALATLAGAVRIDLADVLPAVDVPSLVIHAKDDLVPIQMAWYLADTLPRATLVEIEGSDHAPWISDPARCMGVIEEFVTGHRSGAGARRRLATVVFTDIVRSTERAAAAGDASWRSILERFDEVTRAEVERAGGRLLKSLGDGHLSTFDGPGAALACAEALREQASLLDLQLRTGVHTGECEIIGDDIGGMAVHIGARIGALARPDEILVSSTVRDLVVGSNHAFEDRGTHALKGVPDNWKLFALSDRASSPSWAHVDGAGRRTVTDRATSVLARRAPRLLRGLLSAGARTG